jgi:ABC-type transport system involved in cytochrome bd biosynthesis fused ATPase/permease subunit
MSDNPPATQLPPVSAPHALGHARAAGVGALRVLLALQIARTVLRLGFLAAAATSVGRLVMGEAVQPLTVGAAVALILASAIAGFLADCWQAHAEAQLSLAVRNFAGERLDAMSARQVQAVPVGTLVVAIQRYPAAVASLVIGHRAAMTMMGLGPLIAAAALMIVSWQAALAVLALTPVMVVFFALVGDAIRKRADAQEKAFGHLAGQFSDRIRTMPTILANHALDIEEQKLATRLRSYADKSMSVLRIAFLNAGIIDFFSSLSIAMLAVFLGLGHLGLANIPGFSGLELWQSLFILMIAPDYFAPFRRFAEQYHAKAEGEAAAAALDRLLSPREAVAPVTFPGDLLDPLPQRGLIAITGPSGAGKTTLLRAIAGVDGESGMPERFTWVSTDSFLPEGSLGAAIAWNTGGEQGERVARIASQIGLLTEHHLPGGMDAKIAPGGANLSGGQRVRIAAARALASDRTVLADEPTAKLDADTAADVRNALRNISTQRLVIVATHDATLAALADRTIALPFDATACELTA